MHATTLEYHDVFTEDVTSSGFADPGSHSYKLTKSDFQEHLEALRVAQIQTAVLDQNDMSGELSSSNIYMTFDDGGVSAFTLIADMLEEFGWRGHFFMATGKIGERGFMTSAQLRELHDRGHVIGSHSVSHPLRMADLSADAIRQEWRDSLATLTDLMGEEMPVASIPGGQYSKEVAEIASEEGIRYLFTSEPKRKLEAVGDLTLLGRYTLRSFSSADTALSLATGSGYARQQQWTSWNAKKLVKKVMGPVYLTIRNKLVRP